MKLAASSEDTARDSSSSSKSGKTKQDVPLYEGRIRSKKSSRAESSVTFQMSSQYALGSSTNSHWGSISYHLQTQDSRDTSSTSWISRNPSHPGSYGGGPQFRTANYGMAYMYQSTDPHLLHIGAQFNDVVVGGTQMVVMQADWNADPRYQTQSYSMASDLAPMDRYRQETFNDGPYTYMKVHGVEVAIDDKIQLGASSNKSGTRRGH